MKPGLIVCTDALASYSFLSDKHFHFVISREDDMLVELGGPVVNVTVNMIENTWKHFRKLIALRGAYSSKYLNLIIAEYLYRLHYPSFSWIELIRVEKQ